MKKTAIATMIMTLVLIGTTWAQPKRKTPPQVGNPFGLGGTVTAGVKNRQPRNLGDTATHEVGHKGKRRNGQFRPNPTGDGTTQQFRKSGTSEQNNRSRPSQLNTANQPSFMKLGDIKGEVINNQQPNGAKYDGIDGESNDARTKKPNGQRKNNVSRTETVDNNESLMRRPNRRKR